MRVRRSVRKHTRIVRGRRVPVRLHKRRIKIKRRALFLGDSPRQKLKKRAKLFMDDFGFSRKEAEDYTLQTERKALTKPKASRDEPSKGMKVERRGFFGDEPEEDFLAQLEEDSEEKKRKEERRFNDPRALDPDKIAEITFDQIAGLTARSQPQKDRGIKRKEERRFNDPRALDPDRIAEITFDQIAGLTARSQPKKKIGI